MGMSSPEWSRYMHDVIGLSRASRGDQRRGRASHDRPVRDAPSADRRRRRCRPPPRRVVPSGGRVLVQPSSDRRRPREVRARTALRDHRLVRGGRAREAGARRLPRGGASTRRSPPERCAAIEDSANGIRAAHAAGMRVVAIPNRALPTPGGCSRARRRTLRVDRRAQPEVVLNDEGALAEPLRRQHRAAAHVVPSPPFLQVTSEMTSFAAQVGARRTQRAGTRDEEVLCSDRCSPLGPVVLLARSPENESRERARPGTPSELVVHEVIRRRRTAADTCPMSPPNFWCVRASRRRPRPESRAPLRSAPSSEDLPHSFPLPVG